MEKVEIKGNRKKVKVCAYARVSTKDKEQLGSFENQLSYFRREFGESKQYDLVAVYADCGKSGTKLSRPGFDRMIIDAGIDKTHVSGDQFLITGKPKFTRIIVKNTSRFARNVSSDMLIKTLTSNGVYIDFIDTNLSTERPGDLLTLQVFQAMDEHESRDRSRKVIWGMEEGIKNRNILSNSKLYGYRYYPKPENKLVIIPEEAAIVRLIFTLCAEEDMGAYRICKELTKRGIYTRKGKPFNMNTILQMLRNETYTGIGIRKKYTVGTVFERHTTKRTDNPVVFETDKIEPIITKDLYEKVQLIMDYRAEHQKTDEQKRTATAFKGKIVCGNCGRPYFACGIKEVMEKTDKEKKSHNRLYMCQTKIRPGLGTCDNPSVTEQELYGLLMSNTFNEALRINGLDPEDYARKNRIELVNKIIVRKTGELDFVLNVDPNNKRVKRPEVDTS